MQHGWSLKIKNIQVSIKAHEERTFQRQTYIYIYIFLTNPKPLHLARHLKLGMHTQLHSGICWITSGLISYSTNIVITAARVVCGTTGAFITASSTVIGLWYVIIQTVYYKVDVRLGVCMEQSTKIINKRE